MQITKRFLALFADEAAFGVISISLPDPGLDRFLLPAPASLSLGLGSSSEIIVHQA